MKALASAAGMKVVPAFAPWHSCPKLEDPLFDSLLLLGVVAEVVVVVLGPCPLQPVVLVFSQPSLSLLLPACGKV